jgi:thiol-disulfide isomerase/thioredoxin
VSNPAEPFRFSFPDLNGRMVSNTDARFEGKVVLVNISGSWCPNCHDEAPFLAGLYEKYRSRGLEIVTLSFEEPEQLAKPRSSWAAMAACARCTLDFQVRAAASSIARPNAT